MASTPLIWRDGALIVKCPACGHEDKPGPWVAAHCCGGSGCFTCWSIYLKAKGWPAGAAKLKYVGPDVGPHQVQKGRGKVREHGVKVPQSAAKRTGAHTPHDS